MTPIQRKPIADNATGAASEGRNRRRTQGDFHLFVFRLVVVHSAVLAQSPQGTLKKGPG
jgi:hypothetical protein